MPKSVFSDAHDVLVEALVSARRDAGVLQEDLASRIGKNQSFISRIESGQRRVDILEFVALARALAVDPAKLFQRVLSKLPARIDI